MLAFGQSPSTPPPCGSDAVLDPFTGLCHCVGGQVRDPRSPDDCVDPGLPCPGADDIWSESLGRCITATGTTGPVVIGKIPPRPGAAPPVVKRPVQAGMVLGWTAILGVGGAGAWLIYKATAGRPARRGGRR
jgi:hypothetical protein